MRVAFLSKALDKYVFQRDAYLQSRRNLVYDGRPAARARERNRKG